MKAEDNEFLAVLDDVRSHLHQKNASQTVLEYVEDQLVKLHQKYHEHSAQQAAKMTAMLDYVKEIEVRYMLPYSCPLLICYQPFHQCRRIPIRHVMSATA